MRRSLLVPALGILVASSAAGQPTTSQQSLTYGEWWEQPHLREGYVAATLENRKPCAKAIGRSIAVLASEFWQFGADKPDLWSKPVAQVWDTFCSS
jgi:hypothetical protein